MEVTSTLEKKMPVRSNDKWYVPWNTFHVGGVTVLMIFFLFLSFMMTNKLIKNYRDNQKELSLILERQNELNRLMDLKREYRSAQENSENIAIINDFRKFNTYSSADEFKESLKKWQKILHIKNINVTFKKELPVPDANEIMLIPIHLKAQVSNDKILYKFLEKIVKESAGYLVIQKIEFKRIADTSMESLTNIINKNYALNLIEGTIQGNLYFRIKKQ